MLTWLISLIVIQSRLAGLVEAESTRLGHALIFVHILIPVAAIALSFDRADPDRELSILYFIVFFGVFGFDYWSLTETLWSLHPLPGHEEIYTLEVALTSIAIGLTGFWLLWYAAAYISGRLTQKRRSGKEAEQPLLSSPVFIKGSKE